MFARAESFSTQHPLYFVPVRCCQRSWGNPGQDHEIEVFLEGHHFIFWMSESHMNYNTKHLSEQFQNASFRYTILSPASVLRRDYFVSGFGGCPWSSSHPPPPPQIQEFLFSISEAPEVQSLMAKLEKSLTSNLFFQARTAFHHTLVCSSWEKSMPFAARV